jgi:hypothetical protein
MAGHTSGWRDQVALNRAPQLGGVLQGRVCNGAVPALAAFPARGGSARKSGRWGRSAGSGLDRAEARAPACRRRAVCGDAVPGLRGRNPAQGSLEGCGSACERLETQSTCVYNCQIARRYDSP